MSYSPSSRAGAGAPVVRKFPFAFDTPNLLTGAALYTPAVGDLLLDAWFTVETAFDGTTPFADFGALDPDGGIGVLTAIGGGAADLTQADDNHFLSTLQTGEQDSRLSAYAFDLFLNSAALIPQPNPTALSIPGGGNWSDIARRVIPMKFTAATPIKVCVSTTGQTTGADPASTHGAATLYLVTCTPAS